MTLQLNSESLHVAGRGFVKSKSPFSGNGILARSLVKSFLQLGCTVTVWCCRPSGDKNDNTNSNDNHLTPPEISRNSMERLEIISNIVPNDAWRRVDDQSSWADFSVSNLLLSDASEQRASRLQRAVSDADTICVIDWSGAVAYRSILDHRKQQSDTHRDDSDETTKFCLYLNFRVFSFGVGDPKRRAWFDEMEFNAMKNANAVVTLSSQDKRQLTSIFREYQEKAGILGKPIIPIEVVIPPLRQDMESFATSGNTQQEFLLHLPDSIQSRIFRNGKLSGNIVSNRIFSKRPIIACVARQSPEKCIQRFVKFAEMAADANLFEELNLTVVLAGAASDTDYAQKVRERLLRAVPSAVIIDRFLSPNELGAVFSHTILNFHPCSYDAYGMTIVEAAAFGAPTVLAGQSIGAFRLLGKDGCLHADMDGTDENVFTDSAFTKIESFLRDCYNNESSWETISMVARGKALAWNEKSYGERILNIIDSASYPR